MYKQINNFALNTVHVKERNILMLCHDLFKNVKHELPKSVSALFHFV